MTGSRTLPPRHRSDWRCNRTQPQTRKETVFQPSGLTAALNPSRRNRGHSVGRRRPATPRTGPPLQRQGCHRTAYGDPVPSQGPRTSPKGRFWVWRITIAGRQRAKLREVKAELRRRRHLPIPDQGAWLRSMVQGHLGSGTVVGTGAVVVRDLPRDVVAVGVPARYRAPLRGPSQGGWRALSRPDRAAPEPAAGCTPALPGANKAPVQAPWSAPRIRRVLAPVHTSKIDLDHWIFDLM